MRPRNQNPIPASLVLPVLLALIGLIAVTGLLLVRLARQKDAAEPVRQVETTPGATALPGPMGGSTALPGAPKEAQSAGAQAWYATGVDLSPKAGIFSTIAAGPDGSLYIAYLDDSTDHLKIASKDGPSWRIDTRVGSQDARDGWYPSLAVDSGGALHASFLAYSLQQIIYSVRSEDGKWRSETAVEKVSALDTSLVLTGDGAPRIVYFDEAASEIREAAKGSDGWKVSTIGPASREGVTYPAAVDAGGGLHAVSAGQNGGLSYWSQQDGEWRAEAVIGSEGASGSPALAFDADGNPHISYYDTANKVLKYASRSDGSWRSVTVDADGDVGQFSSIAVDASGKVHISYYDAGRTALRYAYGNASGWQKSVVSNDGSTGRYSAIALVGSRPVISYYDDSEKGLMAAFSGAGAQDAGEAPLLSAFHRSGQTFLTWPERSDLRGEVYRVYRSSQPIEGKNLARAALLAEVSEGSSKFWANYKVSDGVWSPRLSEYLVTRDNAPSAGKGTGVLVWTVSLADFQGAQNGLGYYAITVRRNNREEEELFANFRAGPVEEAVGEPEPVEITHSTGVRYDAGEGGHYYIQYVDLRRWNPTFHAPNATNQYYGQNPEDPRLRRALAYAYDYSVYEPTAELCGGKVPETLPVLVFLHGARGNRYSATEHYPYPYCAYGIYPVDQSETWYFGFARSHDYRAGGEFSPDDVVENFTERRVLRMVYDLMRKPPGPPIDTRRVYLFGHSMGGTGSLAFAERYPNVFAAIYSGQPVTHFYATEGYEETWPTNLATKWGPQSLNLPVAIEAPNGWAVNLQKYSGAGVFTWENLRLAFSPEDPLKRSAEDMVPFALDHGTSDDSVLFPTQGQPLYPLLEQSTQPWAGAVNTAEHEWSNFGWPLPALGKVDGAPFWNFGVVLDETVPGFRANSANVLGPPPGPTTYNQSVLWSASWNAWDGAPVDRPGEWQMSFCAAEEGAQRCGGGVPLRVDITPRRLQGFNVEPGKEYAWENRRFADNTLIESGAVTVGTDGVLTVPQVEVIPQGNRLRIFAP